MLNLSAENQSINDALYFLDKALADHNFPLDDHLRAVRKLTKKQFLVKAHLLKIGQVKASEAATKSAWG
jgi:ESCRT-I complex subunit TSG101